MREKKKNKGKEKVKQKVEVVKGLVVNLWELRGTKLESCK